MHATIMCTSAVIIDEVPLLMCSKNWSSSLGRRDMWKHCSFSRCHSAGVCVCNACVLIFCSTFLSCFKKGLTVSSSSSFCVMERCWNAPTIHFRLGRKQSLGYSREKRSVCIHTGTQTHPHSHLKRIWKHGSEYRPSSSSTCCSFSRLSTSIHHQQCLWLFVKSFFSFLRFHASRRDWTFCLSSVGSWKTFSLNFMMKHVNTTKSRLVLFPKWGNWNLIQWKRFKWMSRGVNIRFIWCHTKAWHRGTMRPKYMKGSRGVDH